MRQPGLRLWLHPDSESMGSDAKKWTPKQGVPGTLLETGMAHTLRPVSCPRWASLVHCVFICVQVQRNFSGILGCCEKVLMFWVAWKVKLMLWAEVFISPTKSINPWYMAVAYFLTSESFFPSKMSLGELFSEASMVHPASPMSHICYALCNRFFPSLFFW
jgi:hypothetical protein